jgi:hypothetical protein
MWRTGYSIASATAGHTPSPTASRVLSATADRFLSATAGRTPSAPQSFRTGKTAAIISNQAIYTKLPNFSWFRTRVAPLDHGELARCGQLAARMNSGFPQANSQLRTDSRLTRGGHAAHRSRGVAHPSRSAWLLFPRTVRRPVADT